MVASRPALGAGCCERPPAADGHPRSRLDAGRLEAQLSRLGAAQGRHLEQAGDHRSNQPESDFVICAWRTNDAKHDMTPPELLEFCKAVLNHSPNWGEP